MPLKYLKFATCLSFAAGVALFGESDIALEEITVSANKISQNIKDIPQSISVINSTQLEERGIKSIDELANTLPNISATTGIHEGLSIRGLNGSAFTNSNPITVYVNGIAQSNKYGVYMPITNVERIEVLRGPSSTIYGKDSIGGVISIVLKEPANEWSGDVGVEYGSHKYRLGTFETSGAIIDDKLYLGLNGSASKDGGWVINDLKGKKSNDKQNYNLGANLKFTPTKRLTMKLFVDTFRKRHNGNDGIMIPYDQFPSITRNKVKHAEFLKDTYAVEKSNSAALNLTYAFDSLNFDSVTTYKKVKQKGNFDMSFGGKDLKKYIGLDAFSDIEIKNISEELRLSSNEDQNIKWIAGVYLENEKTNRKSIGQQLPKMPPYLPNAMHSDSPAKTDDKTASIFGQVVYPLTDKLDLTLGGRYQSIRKKVNANSYSYPLGGIRSSPFKFDDTSLNKLDTA